MLLQLACVEFGQQVQSLECECYLRIYQNTRVEPRGAFELNFHLSEDFGKVIQFWVETSVAPTFLMCRGPRMKLIRVDEHHGSGWGYVLAAPVMKALST
ncbi:hypothetical protein D3C76_1696380 [compost metagenome]